MKQKIHIKKSGFGVDFDFNLRYRVAVVRMRQIRSIADLLDYMEQVINVLHRFARISKKHHPVNRLNFIINLQNLVS